MSLLTIKIILFSWLGIVLLHGIYKTYVTIEKKYTDYLLIQEKTLSISIKWQKSELKDNRYFLIITRKYGRFVTLIHYQITIYKPSNQTT